MTPHPRLLVSANQFERLRDELTFPVLRKASRQVATDAERYLRSRKLTCETRLHNALLLRAREMQTRVVTLLVRWRQTGVETYRKAALFDVLSMSRWRYWSSDREREGNSDPKADFDLSYGENSATLALAYDWLYPTLSATERAKFGEIALRWIFHPFLAQTGKGRRAWWFGHSHSNWNTVCAGGAGMAALAFYEQGKEAAEVLRRVEVSIAPYMQTLETTEGGWIEGIGYWNYGHRYAFWYLLSSERATGRRHPLLEKDGARQTLDFPLDFCPHGQPCSFGDVNLWSPLAFHYSAAVRLGRTELIPRLDKLFRKGSPASDGNWPNAAEALLFHPRTIPGIRQAQGPVQKLYPQLDWGVLADRMPDPNLYLAVRGGEAGWEVPHSQLDLLSFHCVVGRERLIDNLGINGANEYLDTTFSNRRFDLFETTPASKNTLLINGVGINNPAKADIAALAGRGWKGFRLEASSSLHWNDPSSMVFCGRLFLLLDGPLALIIDKVKLKHEGRMEARVHSFSRVKCTGTQALIRGSREQLRAVFASTVPASLQLSESAMTTPGQPVKVLRWCTNERVHKCVAFATLLSPHAADATIKVKEQAGHIVVTGRIGRKIFRLKISRDLCRVALLP